MKEYPKSLKALFSNPEHFYTHILLKAISKIEL